MRFNFGFIYNGGVIIFVISLFKSCHVAIYEKSWAMVLSK